MIKPQNTCQNIQEERYLPQPEKNQLFVRLNTQTREKYIQALFVEYHVCHACWYDTVSHDS